MEGYREWDTKPVAISLLSPADSSESSLDGVLFMCINVGVLLIAEFYSENESLLLCGKMLLNRTFTEFVRFS